LDIADVVPGGRRPARVFEAPCQPGSDEHEACLFESLVRGSDLRHDIAAITTRDKHLLNPANLTFHLAQPPLQVSQGGIVEVDAVCFRR